MPPGPRPPLLVIAGSTATGKTGLSLRLAARLVADGVPAEIISADSRQVYRGLDIGTAKVGPADRARIPHHGLDLVEPDEPFTVVDFGTAADAALDGIAARGGLAVLAGGTGLYLRAVARGFPLEALPGDASLRDELERELAEGGLGPLVSRLEAVAPAVAATIDRRNPRRVVRALERSLIVGDRVPPPPRGYDGPVAWIGLTVDPVTHRTWIAQRARAQFDAGLIDEAEALRSRFDPALPAFSAIGYREAWAVIDGELTLEAAIELDARRNVAFARRQRTWFRREPDIRWLAADGDALDAALETVRSLVDAGGGRPRRPDSVS